MTGDFVHWNAFYICLPWKLVDLHHVYHMGSPLLKIAQQRLLIHWKIHWEHVSDCHQKSYGESASRHTAGQFVFGPQNHKWIDHFLVLKNKFGIQISTHSSGGGSIWQILR